MGRTVLFWILWICWLLEKNAFGFNEDRKDILQFNIGVYCQNEEQSCDQKMLEGIQLPPNIILKVVEIPFYNQSLSEFDWMSNVNNLFESSQPSLVIGKNHEILRILTGDFRLPYLITEHLTPTKQLLPDNVFNIVPQQEIIHQAIYDLVYKLGWRSVLLMYDDSTGIELMGKLLSIPYVDLKVIKVPMKSVKHLKKSLVLARQLALRNIVLVGEDQNVKSVLQEAFKLSMVSDRYSWISVKMAEGNLDFSEYHYTGVKLLVLDVFSKTEENQTRQSKFNNEVFTVVFKVGEMLQGGDTAVECHKLGNCTSIAKGENFIQSLKEITLSSSKVFDSNNQRNNVSFQILSLQSDGFIETGHWTQDGMTAGERLSSFVPPMSEKNSKLSGRGYFKKGITRVTTLIDPPFVMLKKGHENYSGNAQYEGYLVDMMDIIAKNLGMKYELYQPPDGSYGTQGDDGEWNGMINELIVGNASIMLGAVSITAERENVVDFAKPYKQKSLNILMKKYEKELEIFQFMWPLSPLVWILICSAMAVVSLLLWLMGKTDPEHETVFNFSESLWFSYGSLVLIGTDNIPQTISGRLLTGTWWFFSLIIISSYTASLAAFLTVSKIDSPVKNLADLADQSKIKVGTIKNTATMTTFRNSNDETYKKLWSLMQDFGSDNLCDLTEKCVEKVKAGDFAFIWDTPINDYITSNECSLMTVGNPFEENMYGIGVPLGASFRDAITMEILNMNEDGTLLRLEKKWWEKGKCDPTESGTDSSTKELSINNVAGVFILLLVGLVVSIVACIIECSVKRKDTINKKATDSKYKHSSPEHFVEEHNEGGTETNAIPQPMNEIEIESQM